jgi:hypothetical protein
MAPADGNSGRQIARLTVVLLIVAHRVARLSLLVLTALLPAVALGSCSSPTHRTPEASSCGYAYFLYLGSQTVGLGTCAGNIPATPMEITASVGQRFEVKSVTEGSGRPDYTAPTSGSPTVVTLLSISGYGGDGSYIATKPGIASLFTRSASCLGGSPGSTVSQGGSSLARVCAVLQVNVVPKSKT